MWGGGVAGGGEREKNNVFAFEFNRGDGVYFYRQAVGESVSRWAPPLWIPPLLCSLTRPTLAKMGHAYDARPIVLWKPPPTPPSRTPRTLLLALQMSMGVPAPTSSSDFPSRRPTTNSAVGSAPRSRNFPFWEFNMQPASPMSGLLLPDNLLEVTEMSSSGNAALLFPR